MLGNALEMIAELTDLDPAHGIKRTFDVRDGETGCLLSVTYDSHRIIGVIH